MRYPAAQPLLTAGRTVAMLGLLAVPLPAALAVTGLALATGSWPARRATAGPPRTVMISGGKMTKALALARAFSAAGHRVVLVETARYRTAHRWSRAVDRFHTVPEPDDPDYAPALRRIAQREGVDLFLPVSSPVASRYDARARDLLEPACEVFCADPDLVELLDDKHRFAELAESLGLPVARSYRITSAEQVASVDLAASEHGYLLKSMRYDPAGRLDPVRLTGRDPQREAALVRALPISERHPWVLQEFLVGQEFCTHSTVRDGHVQVYACCPSSASQLNYASVDVPEIEKWVRRFCEQLRLTGQVAFDFIRTSDGEAHAIECNPRTHSAVTTFYDSAELAGAYLTEREGCLTPTPGNRPTYWLYEELWGVLRDPRTLPGRVRTVLHGKDAVFAWSDPLPFLVLHAVQLPALLLQDLRRGRRWVRVDVNIGKLVEPGGD